MKVEVRITSNFKSEAKPLLRKYPSLSNDLLKLEAELSANPRMGTPLGHEAYKIRLRITSKRKGKSGGARVITHVESIVVKQKEEPGDELTFVKLISIYDKSEVATITDKELRELIKVYKGG